jgi:hypothetical protein
MSEGSGPISALSYPPDLTRLGAPLALRTRDRCPDGGDCLDRLQSEGPERGPGGTPGGAKPLEM